MVPELTKEQRIANLMHALSIAESKRVGGLGVKQAQALIDRLGGE